MKKRMDSWFVVMAVGLVALACGGGGLTRGDVLKHYDKVNALSIEVADAEGKEGAILAPEGFVQVKELLEDAIDYAMKGDKDDADEKAQQGLTLIVQIRKNMATALGEFEETLQTRERARLEGAPGLYSDEWTKAEAEFMEAASLIEDGKINKAREQRIELQQTYADLELRALKEGKKAAAEAAVKHAEESDADDYAPKTFHKAKEELKLVTAVLEADRTQKEKADAHAARTIWLAGRAEAITELAKMFEDADFELEDIVLWHQEQLEHVNQPLTSELPFDESDARVVQSLQNSIGGLLKSIADMRKIIQTKEAMIDKQQAEYEKKIADILEAHATQLAQLNKMSKKEINKIQRDATERLAAASAELDAESAKKKRYQYVVSLFGTDEAEISQKDGNILISVHGFDFPARGTDIGSQNFGLLDKIVSAIGKYPASQIKVTGHTDSKGSKSRNLNVSLKRAESVAQFLTTIGGIEAKRVNSSGAGEEHPIASNDSRKGRAKNRRIEILLQL